MLHERLRDENESWGLTHAEAREKARQKAIASNRRKAAASRVRSERGRFVAKAPPLAPVLGEFWVTSDGYKAYTEAHERVLLRGITSNTSFGNGTRVSLAYVSIQHSQAQHG